MRLKNVLITVQDTKRAKTFYKDLFGLDVILDGDANVMLTEGAWERRRRLTAVPRSFILRRRTWRALPESCRHTKR